MFIAHIALALELISLGIGAILVLKCCRNYTYCHPNDRYLNEPISEHTAHTDKKSCKQHGFLKFVGYLIMVLSFLSIICTFIGYFYLVSRMELQDALYQNEQIRIYEQYDNTRPTNPPLPAHPTPHHKMPAP